MRIGLFVTELYLRNTVSDHHVSASGRPAGLWLSHVHNPVAESASKCFGLLHWIKVSVGLDEQWLITKSFAGCFLLPVEGSQSSLTSLWTSLASCKPLSLVNLVQPLH